MQCARLPVSYGFICIQATLGGSFAVGAGDLSQLDDASLSGRLLSSAVCVRACIEVACFHPCC